MELDAYCKISQLNKFFLFSVSQAFTLNYGELLLVSYVDSVFKYLPSFFLNRYKKQTSHKEYKDFPLSLGFLDYKFTQLC